MSSHRTRVGSYRARLGEVVSHVNLTHVTPRDGGTYTCTAHNTHGQAAHTTRLNVYGPPFVRPMGNVSAVEGEDVWLWCPAGGYPTPTVSWRRDGHPVPTSLRQEVLSNGTLVVRSASLGDEGRYTCQATSRQGGQTATGHTFLHVLKPPSIEAFSFRPNLKEGDRTQLSCLVTSGDLPIAINWLKDGRHLQHDPDIEVKQVHKFSSLLFFKALQEHHSGSYTCEAANAAAAANHTATVKVKVSPRWVVEPGGGTALVGSSVVMDCSARGFPQPAVSWLKAPGKVAQDFQPLRMEGPGVSVVSNGSLVLHKVAPSQAGWYLCRASNNVGDPISKVVQLTVHAPARVVTEGGRVTGHAGHAVTLTCQATGDPPLTLTWTHHHSPITQDHRTVVREERVGGRVAGVLEVRGLRAGDAGAYTCLAANPHGEHTQAFTLAVIEPPQAPSRVEVGEVGSRSVRVSWSLPHPAAVTLQYKDEEHKSWGSHGRNVSVGQWATSHLLTGLTPHHTYALRLMAHNDLGVSPPSPVYRFTTREEAPTGAPVEVRVVAGSDPHSLVVSWRAPPHHLINGALRGYTIALRRQNLQGQQTFITRPVTALTSEGVEQYEVRELEADTLYEVAVRAFNRAGPGPLSTPRIVDSTAHDAPSCAPGGVTCRGSGRGSVRVWWSPPPSHCTQATISGYIVLATPTKHLYQSSSSTWEVRTTNLEKNLDSLPPATNVSVRVKAFNEVGAGPSNSPVYCVTEDDVPGPPRQVRVTVTGASSVLVHWSPPLPHTGTILHYTLYSSRDNQVVSRVLVGAGGSGTTWKELHSLTTAARIQVWVTATTVAGEGSQSPRLTVVPAATPKYSPVAVGGGRMWAVDVGSGVTLSCRGLGSPTPTVTWTKNGAGLATNPLIQLLPGGDLHLTSVRETANYSCLVRNSVGTDSLTHRVVAVTSPAPPALALTHASHHTLNLSITPANDGGTPILGYTVHYRGRAGEWMEVGGDAGVGSMVVRGLACGAAYHAYLTAWNTHGPSSSSPVLVANTLGSPPGRPDPGALVEVNQTCVTLRLYVWPELGCPITHWKVEVGKEGESRSWQPQHPHVGRDTMDLGLCDLPQGTWHLLRVTAASTAGDTTLVYRVATRDQDGGSITAEPVQEVQTARPGVAGGWLDAHVVAAVISSVLLATAFLICVCVALRRQRYGGYRPGESLDSKGSSGEEDNQRNSELTRTHLYSPTPTKKPRGSLASLKTQDDSSEPYEICPYATFSERRPQHHQSPTYGQGGGRHRAQSHYKETEIAYISNRKRSGGGGEYGSRPKSLPAVQHPSEGNPPTTPSQHRTDHQHHSRSHSRGEASVRDSSTESNDASSSPVQPPPLHYQHPLPHYPQQAGGVRLGPHPLPPVRLPRVASRSSSSEGSPLTPPRPLHPPSAFSDSRELSEAECDRELHQGGVAKAAGGVHEATSRGRGSNSDKMANELFLLLHQYEKQQKEQYGGPPKLSNNKLQPSLKLPHSINV